VRLNLEIEITPRRVVKHWPRIRSYKTEICVHPFTDSSHAQTVDFLALRFRISSLSLWGTRSVVS
jgi:hypothetical protein